MNTWLQVAVDEGRRRGVAEEVIAALSAFSNPWPRGGPGVVEWAWEGSFAALDGSVGLPAVEEISAALDDVDPAQAAMFGRRVHDVAAALVGGHAEGLLHLGLRVRLAAILHGPTPRALRVRALADFYYSQGARLRWGRGEPLVALASRVRWAAVADGVERGAISGRGPDGPLEAWLLRVDPRRARLQVLHRQDAAEVPFKQTLASMGAVAGVSGGFFLYSEPDIEPPAQRYDPVGLLLSGGVVRSAPWLRRGALLWRPGAASLGVVGAEGVFVGGRDAAGVDVWTRARGPKGPDVDSVAVAGGLVVAAGRRLAVPLNGAVLACPGAPGERVVVQPPSVGQGGAVEGLAGGPILRANGRAVDSMEAEDFWGTAPPVTFSQDETGGQNLLPRHGVGLDEAGRLVFAAVDGRDFERSLGLSLAGLGELLGALGCPTALNLDGGSSKRMVIGGEVVDRSSTEVRGAGTGLERIRPVRTGIAILS